MIYLGIPVVGILGYIIVFPIFLILATGLALFFSAIGAYIADLGNVWSICTQLLFFLSPIFHAVTPGTSLYAINLFNPLYYLLAISRDLILYQRLPSVFLITVMLIMTAVIFSSGLYLFERNKKKFPELV